MKIAGAGVVMARRDDSRPQSRGDPGRAQVMISAVTFASCYVYSPGGSGVTSERSRLMRDLLKDGDAYFIDKYATRVRQQVAEGPSLAGFFRASSVLVPIPGSAPRPEGVASVADHLAGALLSEGLGSCIWPGLRRISPVRKSGTSAPGLRPSVGDHYASLAVVSTMVAAGAAGMTVTKGMTGMAALAGATGTRTGRMAVAALPSPPRNFVLVDDVVTKGRTLLAAAARVQEAFPSAEVRAFALIRTMGLIPSVDHLLDPCVGEIQWRCGDAYRTP